MWLVLSDSHDNMDKLKKIPDLIQMYNIDTIFHCGDFVAPFTLPYLIYDDIDFYGVFGNNDGEKLLLYEKSNKKIKNGPITVEKDGKKIFLMHEPYSLEAAENSGIYDYVFFGHTHEIVNRKTGKTIVLNPGEFSGWLTGKTTYGIIDPSESKVEIKEL